MQITTRKVEAVTLVIVSGETLDASNAYEFKEEIATLLTENEQVVFDLGQLQFMDSSGLGAMLACFRLLTGSGGKLKLCNVQKPVRMLFDTVRMHRVIDILSTPEEAIGAFNNTRLLCN